MGNMVKADEVMATTIAAARGLQRCFCDVLGLRSLKSSTGAKPQQQRKRCHCLCWEEQERGKK